MEGFTFQRLEFRVLHFICLGFRVLGVVKSGGLCSGSPQVFGRGTELGVWG